MDSAQRTPSLTAEGKFFETVSGQNQPISLLSEVSDVHNIAKDTFDKYPPDSKVTKLTSTLEIKQYWLHSEWSEKCQFSKRIRENFPKREDLHPTKEHPDVKLIETTFDYVRGRWLLWQEPREQGRWKKVEVTALTRDWILKNVDVLYPTKDQFPVLELRGIVLWYDKSSKKYHLYEGNHRISALLASLTPESVPGTIFIGKPRKILKGVSAFPSDVSFCFS